MMEIPALCQGPNLQPRHPRFRMPAGATDTHFHLFGPQDRYPLVDLREYTPPLITPALARQLFDTLGIQRAVVIQPSVYGDDNRAQLEGAKEIGIPTRAVIVARQETSDQARSAARAGRARTALCSRTSGRASAFGPRAMGRTRQGARLAHPIAGQGPATLGNCPAPGEARLSRRDRSHRHVQTGRRSRSAGLPSGAALGAARQLGKNIRCVPPFAATAALPRTQAFCDATRGSATRQTRAGERLAACFYQKLDAIHDRSLDLLADWVPDEATRNRILVDNPAALYGF